MSFLETCAYCSITKHHTDIWILTCGSAQHRSAGGSSVPASLKEVTARVEKVCMTDAGAVELLSLVHHCHCYLICPSQPEPRIAVGTVTSYDAVKAVACQVNRTLLYLTCTIDTIDYISI